MNKTCTTIIVLIGLLLSCYTASAIQEQYDSTTADGYILNPNGDYLTARDYGQGDILDDSGNYLKVGQDHGASWIIYRSFLYFDTSGIPDAVNVQKAWLYFNVKENPIAVRIIDDSGHTYPRSTLQLDDFNFYVYDLYGWPQGVSSTGWRSIILRDDDYDPGGGGISDSIPISNTGTTRFVMICEKDYQSDDYDTGIMNIYSGDSSNNPYLIVQYNTPPSSPEITGNNRGSIQQFYSLELTATDDDIDNDNNQIKFKVEWGDGETSWGPDGYMESGDTTTIRHKYENVGNYVITITAYDNSGETNDHGGSATKTIEVISDPIRTENPSWWDNFISWITSIFLGDEDEGPNQKFKTLRGQFKDSGDGGKHLGVWWEVNKAARDQGDLMVFLWVETIDGITELGTHNVQHHDSQDEKLWILNWDDKFPGYSEWSFTLKAKFLNPTEPSGSDLEDNKIELGYFLGLELHSDFFIASGLFIAFIVIVVLIYKFRKRLFWRFYLKLERKDLEKMRPEGSSAYMHDWLEKRIEKGEKRARNKAKKKEVMNELMKEIKSSAKESKKSGFFNTIFGKKTKTSTSPVKKKPKKKYAKKDKRKQQKTIIQTAKEFFAPSQPAREYGRIQTLAEIYTKPTVEAPEDWPTLKEIERGKRFKHVRKRNDRARKACNNWKRDVNEVDELSKKRDRIRDLFGSSSDSTKNRAYRLKTYAGDINPKLINIGKKLAEGKATDVDLEKEAVRTYNMLDQKIFNILKKRGYEPALRSDNRGMPHPSKTEENPMYTKDIKNKHQKERPGMEKEKKFDDKWMEEQRKKKKKGEWYDPYYDEVKQFKDSRYYREKKGKKKAKKRVGSKRRKR